MVKYCGNREWTGDQIFDGYVAIGGGVSGTLSYTTVEDLTIQVNPITGNDFTIPTILQTQAQFTTHGAFASYRGAISALPSHINHPVVLAHAGGAYSVAQDYFGDVSRLTFSNDGSLLYDSASDFTQSSGSVDMGVSSSIGGETVTLSADPEYVADTYVGKWLKIISGVGIGQYKAIRTHADTVFSVAGRFQPAPDSSSTVRIVEPSVSITVLKTDYAIVELVGNDSNSGGLNKPVGVDRINVAASYTPAQIGLGKIAITSDDAYLRLVSKGIGLTFQGTILTSAYLYATGRATLTPWNLITKNNGTIGGTAISVLDGSFLKVMDNDASILINNYTIAIQGGSGDLYRPSVISLHHLSIDNCTAAIYVTRDTHVYLVNCIHCMGITRYGIEFANIITNGSAHIYLVDALADGLTGILGDISLYGTVVSYEDLNAASDKAIIASNNIIILKGE